MSKNCFFPGSFDPITVGHLDMIKRLSVLFDKVIVGVMNNSAKKNAFSAEYRVEMIRKCVADISNVEVLSSDGLTIEAARTVGATLIARGVRSELDYAAEMQAAVLNRHLSKGLETLLLPSAPEYAWISSSIVREAAYYGGSIQGLVPDVILEDVLANFR